MVINSVSIGIIVSLIGEYLMIRNTVRFHFYQPFRVDKSFNLHESAGRPDFSEKFSVCLSCLFPHGSIFQINSGSYNIFQSFSCCFDGLFNDFNTSFGLMIQISGLSSLSIYSNWSRSGYCDYISNFHSSGKTDRLFEFRIRFDIDSIHVFIDYNQV